MEKKYYFRGLGLGIIVTAVIMGVALSGGGTKEKMTDAEIIARAKELGMVENSTLLEAAGEEENGQDEAEAAPVKKDDPVRKDISVAAEAAEKEEAELEKTEKEKTEIEKNEEEENEEEENEEKPVVGTPENQAEEKSEPAADTNEMTKQDEDIPKPETETATTKSVTISSGDGSYTVAKKLEEAGVVSSAAAYDDFLCANGYDKKLRPGTFEIPADAGDEEIARIVTRQQ